MSKLKVVDDKAVLKSARVYAECEAKLEKLNETEKQICKVQRVAEKVLLRAGKKIFKTCRRNYYFGVGRYRVTMTPSGWIRAVKNR